MLHSHVILLSHIDGGRRSGLFPSASLARRVDQPNTMSVAKSKYYASFFILQLLALLKRQTFSFARVLIHSQSAVLPATLSNHRWYWALAWEACTRKIIRLLSSLETCISSVKIVPCCESETSVGRSGKKCGFSAERNQVMVSFAVHYWCNSVKTTV
jgi:hypothetical protein